MVTEDKLLTPGFPPPGSIYKLAPNATLINLKKLKEKQELNKLFKIEEVTVLIDDQDLVKVVDYGPKDGSEYNNCKYHKVKTEINDDLYFDNSQDEVSKFEQFYDSSLGNILENMRQLHIDCNTIIADSTKKYSIYAHRTILISKSRYFFKQLYLKHRNKLNQFSKFVLPIEIEYSILDALISYIYTGSLQYLLQKNSKEVKTVLSFLEMKDALDLYEQEINEEIRITDSSEVCIEGGVGESVLLLPCMEENKTSIIEVDEEKSQEKRKKRKQDPELKNDYYGKLKVSVQKLVENALSPFILKIEELFDPSGSTLYIARTSQHIITLCHADILLTKLFDQNELTKFFSEIMSELQVNASSSLSAKDLLLNTYNDSDNVVNYTVTSLSTQTGNDIIDNSYTKCGLNLISEEEETLSDINMINYHKLSAKHIPKYVHMIAMYKFYIYMKKGEVATNKNSNIIHPLLENDSITVGNDPINVGNDSITVGNDSITVGNNSITVGNESINVDSNSAVGIEDLVNGIVNSEAELLNESCFNEISFDLKKRIIADLELYVNPSFHEELIMHIIVDQMDEKHILPFTIAVFLAKGCNFCRKKECKIEDLSMPITPDNPVCPDRQCIKQNIECDICFKQMSTSKSLARHKYSVHDIQYGCDPSSLFICSHCGDTFSKKWRLNMHERDHEDKKTELTCHICKKRVKGAVCLKKHISSVHEAKAQYNCEYCPKSFKRKETLSVHRRIHTGEKPFKCTHCVYASETKGNLKAHVIRKHKYVPITPEGNSTHIIGVQEAHVISEEGEPLPDDQVMTSSIVAHTLSDGSFIITSGND